MPEETTTTEATDVTTQREAAPADDYAELKESIRKERDARRAIEKEATELRRFRDERTKAEQSETERLAAREKTVADQEQRITERLRASILRDEVSSAVTAEKITLNAPVGDVLRFIESDAVEWDGETPKNVRSLLRELVKGRPYLASRRTGSADGGAGQDQAGPQSMNDLIRSRVGR